MFSFLELNFSLGVLGFESRVLGFRFRECVYPVLCSSSDFGYLIMVYELLWKICKGTGKLVVHVSSNYFEENLSSGFYVEIETFCLL